MSTESENVQTVRAVLAAFTARDFPTLEVRLADDFELETRPGTLNRKIANKAKFFETLTGLEHVIAGGSVKHQPIEIIDAPGSNQVVVHAKSVDTFSKDGKTPYTNEYIFIATLREGKVVRWKEFMDSKFTSDFIATLPPRP